MAPDENAAIVCPKSLGKLKKDDAPTRRVTWASKDSEWATVVLNKDAIKDGALFYYPSLSFLISLVEFRRLVRAARHVGKFK